MDLHRRCRRLQYHLIPFGALPISAEVKWLISCARLRSPVACTRVAEHPRATGTTLGSSRAREVLAILAGPCRRPCGDPRQRAARQKGLLRRQLAPVAAGSNAPRAAAQARQKPYAVAEPPQGRAQPHRAASGRRGRVRRRHKLAAGRTKLQQAAQLHRRPQAARPLELQQAAPELHKAPPARSPVPAPVEASSAVVWLSLRLCESVTTQLRDAGNGYYGAYNSRCRRVGTRLLRPAERRSSFGAGPSRQKLQAEAAGAVAGCSAEIGL